MVSFMLHGSTSSGWQKIRVRLPAQSLTSWFISSKKWSLLANTNRDTQNETFASKDWNENETLLQKNQVANVWKYGQNICAPGTLESFFSSSNSTSPYHNCNCTWNAGKCIFVDQSIFLIFLPWRSILIEPLSPLQRSVHFNPSDKY